MSRPRKRRRVSQRVARAALARVRVLEAEERDRRRFWASEWPVGVHLGDLTIAASDATWDVVATARKLEHAVVVVADRDQGVRRLRFLALPLTSKEQ